MDDTHAEKSLLLGEFTFGCDMNLTAISSVSTCLLLIKLILLLTKREWVQFSYVFVFSNA